jgi:hypothetical protein
LIDWLTIPWAHTSIFGHTVYCFTFTEIPLLCSLIHFFIVATSIVQQGEGVTAPLAEFANVFDPSGDPQKAFMGMSSSYPNFVGKSKK